MDVSTPFNSAAAPKNISDIANRMLALTEKAGSTRIALLKRRAYVQETMNVLNTLIEALTPLAATEREAVFAKYGEKWASATARPPVLPIEFSERLRACDKEVLSYVCDRPMVAFARSNLCRNLKSLQDDIAKIKNNPYGPWSPGDSAFMATRIALGLEMTEINLSVIARGKTGHHIPAADVPVLKKRKPG